MKPSHLAVEWVFVAVSCGVRILGNMASQSTRKSSAPLPLFIPMIAQKPVTHRKLVFAVLLTAAISVSLRSRGSDAPGAPGVGSAWTSGAKNGLGTAAAQGSKVWFTLGQGILNEVYYPQVDVPNVQDLQFIITDGASFVDVERDDTTHVIELPYNRALTYRQINHARSGKYRLTKTYITDSTRPTLLIQTRFEVLSGGPYRLYVLFNPSLNNSGQGDTGGTSGKALVASDGPVASALMTAPEFQQMTSGYSGTESDALANLKASRTLSPLFDSASQPGNIVQAGQIPVGGDTTFVLALGFGSSRAEALANATASLSSDFGVLKAAYENGWQAYLDSLYPPPALIIEKNLLIQYNVALMTLKAHEDKTFPGANVASLTIPWGQAVDADKCCPTGYHAVWARDLYEVATAQIAAGDPAAAQRSLDYLLNVQQREDGSMPQNSRVDGSPTTFRSLQMDEVAFPIVLAWQLDRADGATWAKLKKSADFLVNRGPATPQERWEENGGISPSTLAAEIAGLVCAADLASRNGDRESASTYLATADEWQRNVERWTITTNGSLGLHHYFIRIDDNQDPDDGHSITIGNGGGGYDEREIVDAGFLELVRLGVKPANDPSVAQSLPVIDATIRVATPAGDLFYRYNHDGYGEEEDGAPYTGTGIGRLWPIFTGERGEYELANGRKEAATACLLTMAKTANDGFMIPEQVWDRSDGKGRFDFGKGTDSATPLVWSMAQFVRLARSLDARTPVETPAIVAARYADASPPGTVTFNVTVPEPAGDAGKTVFLTGELNKAVPPLSSWDPAGLKMTRLDPTHWRATVQGRSGTTFLYKYTLGDWPSAEKNADGKDIPNRQLTFAFDASGRQSITDTAAAWGQAAGAAGPREVKVRFIVTVPSGTDTTGKKVHIAGTLDQIDSSLPVWDPGGTQLTRLGTNQWQVEFTGKEGAAIEYKYTLGDWAHVEKAADCGEIPNRAANITYGAAGVLELKDTVANWRNVPPCGE